MTAHPLTSSQREIWFNQQLHPGSPLYHIGGYVDVRGALDPVRFERAVAALIRKHDNLRLVLLNEPDEDGLPLQALVEPFRVAVPVHDCSAEPDPRQAALDWMQARFGEPFDLARPGLFQYALVRLAPDRTYWFLKYHHLILDGWALAMLCASLADLYSQLGRAEEPDVASPSFGDFIQEDRRYIASEAFERDRQFWLAQFPAGPEPMLRPLEPPPDPASAGTSGNQLLILPRDFYGRLGELARGNDATVFHVLVAALYVYFTRTCGRGDLVLGLPVLNRSNARFRATAGLFVSVLPTRFAFGQDLTFAELLRRIGQTLRGNYRHQRFPASEIGRSLGLERNAGLFDITLSFENLDFDHLFDGLDGSPHSLLHGRERTPLAIFVREYRATEDVACDFVFNRGFFTAGQIVTLQARLLTLLEAVLELDQAPIRQLPIMTAAEAAQLQAWNPPAQPVPLDRTLAELFEGRAAATPEAEAVVADDGALSYGELNRRANQLAHQLVALGVGPEVRVAICARRCLAMVVAVLAVVKAGGAYVPIPAELPAARRDFILADCGAALLLTHEGIQAEGRVLRLEAASSSPEHNLPVRSGPDNLAYLIYTSGSTGQPKGVMIEQRSLLNTLFSYYRFAGFSAADRMLSVASFAFDVAVHDLFATLCAGATLVLAGRDDLLDPARFEDLLAAQRISLFGATPLLISQLRLDPERLPHLRLIFSGGEAVSRSHLAGVPAQVAIMNGYGPTEATITTTTYTCQRSAEEPEALPIGRPIDNYRVYLLDADGAPLPPGVPGELCVAGLGLARGYLGNPELTASRFPELELFGQRQRVYRSGDLARWRPDGNLEYLGRLDQQIKLRGFRIEPGEIEAALTALPEVREAVVIARGTGNDRQLVGYVVGGSPERALDPAALRRSLRARLPEYMVPAALVVLERLPLTANLKLDRGRLPAPDSVPVAEETAPLGSESERQLADVWSELLHQPVPGPAANFFDLGGHSLQVTRLASRIRDRFGIDMPLGLLFEHAGLGEQAAWLDRQQQGELPPAIVALSAGQPRVLSYAQQRLWFLAQLEGDSATYNMPAALELTGDLDLPALTLAFAQLQQRQQSLRLAFPERNGQPLAELLPVQAPLTVVDLAGHPEPAAELRRRLQAHAAAPFDLHSGPLLKVELLQLGPLRQVLLVNLHHIIADGWSVGVLLRELRTLYGAHREGRVPALAPLPVQYTDYAAWQRRWLQGPRLQAQLDYWVAKLAGAPHLLELPTDFPRPALQDHRGDCLRSRLPRALGERLKALGRQQDCTLFMTLLAGFSVLLARLSGQDQLAVGTPVANRTHGQTEDLVGFFVNTLVLRTRIAAGDRFLDVLAQVRDNALEAYAHQDVPFEHLVEALNPPRTLSHAPLFQVLLAVDQEVADLALPGLAVSLLPSPLAIAKFDLTLGISEDADGLLCAWEFATALFEPASIRRFAEQFEDLLEQLLAAPATPLAELGLSAAERRTLDGWNATAQPVPALGAAQLFEAQVARTPAAEALVAGGERLDYAGLNRRANRLAHQLRSRGIGPEARVAISIDRSSAMVVAVLAVLKAGAGYVPIAPELPAARKRFLLEDCAAPLLLTEGDADWAPCQALAIAAGDAWPEGDPPACSRPEHLAYVIYTSGSTGEPKGVMIEQAALVNAITAFNRVYRVGPGDRTLQIAPFAFDVSVCEILPILCAGGALVLPAADDLLDPARFLALLAAEAISFFGATPLRLAQLRFEAGDLPRLRLLFSGGEALAPAHLAGIPASLPVVNGYGPTEATIGATAYPLRRSPEEAIRLPIGRPLANYRVHILDRELRPQPLGVPGELCLAGAGLARGYLNRPEQTAQAFVEVQLGDRRERIYRTGDRARWLADGNLEFLGRLDNQVKLRGFRIELGEIEAALGALPAVREVAVLTRGAGADQRLVAYVAGPPELDPAELRRALRARLPEYMVPASYVVLERLPLNSNGKLEPRALPEPAPAADAEGLLDPLEEIVAGLWASLLGGSLPGRQDNFFEQGGHSLLAAQLAARLREALGGAVPVRWIFEAPTVADLAGRLRTGAEAAEPVPANLLVPGLARLTPELLPLVRLSQAEVDGIVARVAGGAGNVQDIYPLAPLQEGILFHHLLQTTGDPYLGRVLLAFASPARRAEFVAALQQVSARHDILRTAFLWAGLPAPVQVVWRQAPLPIEQLAFDPAGGTLEAQLRAHCDPARLRLDLTRAPLQRIVLAEAGGRWLLALISHHLILDHATLALMLEEVRIILAGGAAQLPAPVPYRGFAARMRRQLDQGGHEAFFRAMLGGVASPSTPFGLGDVRGDGGAARVAQRQLAPALAGRLRAQARSQGATPAALCHLAWGLVLARFCGKDEAVFGTVLEGRMQGGAGVERALGMFINTLPLRVQSAGLSVAAALRQTQQRLLQLLRHEHAPLSLALRCSAVPAPAPLFSALLNYRQGEAGGFQLDGVELLDSHGQTNFPMVLEVDDSGAGFRLAAGVDPSIDPDRVCAFMEAALEALVAALEQAPETACAELAPLPAAEAEHLRSCGLGPLAATPATSLQELFEAQAARAPGAPALLQLDQTLSYGELNARANQLAQRLLSLGIGPEARVAIRLPRSFGMVIAVLAVLKTGAAYVPLASDLPAARQRFILADCGAAALVTEEPAADAPCPVLPVAAAGWPEDNPEPRSRPEHLAYVIYTSGSSGEPKGVLIEQGALLHAITAFNRVYGMGPADRTLQLAAFAFDVSVCELLAPLCSGGALVLPSRGQQLDPQRLRALIAAQGITWFGATPLLLAQLTLDRASLPRLRLLFSGGEALAPAHLAGIDPELPVVNGYGPTEATIGATAYRLRRSPEEAECLPIGKPLSNYQVFILDPAQRPLPFGVPGELCIGGPGLARGYLNRPELTAAQFVEVELFGARRRLYRTGDLARWRADGELVFLGRIDQQIKLRGFRIELGEIEAALGQLPGVREARVLARGEGADRRLLGYVTGAGLEPLELRAALATRLPEYMVPAALVILETLPLTANGKLDQARLPAPERPPDPAYQAPRSAAEARMADLWEELLGLAPISVNADFFALGGHSLLAMRLMDRIQTGFGRTLPLASLFAGPSIAQLVALLEAELPAAGSILVPIQPAGTRPALYLLPGAGGHVLYFRALARALGPEQPVYGLETPGLRDPAAIPGSLPEHAARLLEALRSQQPDGPYQLAGHSAGGPVAFELARQLRAQGQEVARLIILDAPAPQPGSTALSGPEARRELDRIVAELGLEGLDLDGIAQVYAAMSRNQAGYQAPAALDRPLLLVRAAASRVAGDSPDWDWSALAAGIEVLETPGSHLSMLTEPDVRALASQLRRHLLDPARPAP